MSPLLSARCGPRWAGSPRRGDPLANRLAPLMNDRLAALTLRAAGSVHLLGGGWDPEARASVYGPFLDQAGPSPVIACVVLDEGDGPEQFLRWSAVLREVASCEPFPVLVPQGGLLDVAQLADAAGVLVCGGLTPAYASALGPAAPQLRSWLEEGRRPYAGFSAGAAIAAAHAVVGGWRSDGVQVCPQDASEDLDEVTVVPGLGLLQVVVDVHCAQWGTLPRLVAAVSHLDATVGLGIDEDTAVHVVPDGAVVAGVGNVRVVTGRGSAVSLQTVRAGRPDLH